MFIEQPTVAKLLTSRGGSIDVDKLAAILNRTAPTKDIISKACANLYAIAVIDLIVGHLYMMKIGSKRTSAKR